MVDSDERQSSSLYESSSWQLCFKVRAASNPGAVMAVKVEVVRGLSFTLWMVVLCFLTCLVLLYSYYALLGKYRK